MEFHAMMSDSDYSSDAGQATKTLTNDGKRVLWCEGDKVSIFQGEDINDEYVVKEGFGGKTTTKLIKVEDDSFCAGSETTFDANIALYPYANVSYSHFEREDISSEPVFCLEVPIPSVQKYSTNTFGSGAFPMVAVSANKADNRLAFRNLFGLIKIQLKKNTNYYYCVKDIVVKGNNNERLSGDAVVKCSYSAAPEVVFADGASNDYVKLDCGVELIPGDEIVEFWIALPYGQYEKGLTVVINFSNGEKQEKSTGPIEIARSVMTPMPVLDADSEKGELYIPDSNFKKMLLNMEIDGVKVDMDGDGFLTAKDAKAWNEHYKDQDVEFNLSSSSGIQSLRGIEYFTSLTSLIYVNSDVTNLDLSHNTALKTLVCSGDEYNRNLVIDISKNINLTHLDCEYTAMKELDLSKHTALEYLDCGHNNMTRLDVSNNTTLKTLICYGNELTELDISKNAALTKLLCGTNKLTSLDMSKNTALTEVNCANNIITSISIGDNPALKELSCQDNQLADLNLSKCDKLHSLSCGGNQMKTLDVSMTAIGSGKSSYPLFCRMESLQTLYLLNGWKIRGINVDRSTQFIPENTEIKYKNKD